MPLVPLRPLMEAAEAHSYAQGAFNVNAVAQAKAVIEMHETFRSPAILQGADLANAFMGGRVDFQNGTLEDKKKGARNIANAVKKYGENSPIPVVLHLDHGKDFDSCVAAIEGGYTSVMIDGSKLSFEENIAVTRKVVEYAHDHGVMVEGELGKLAGIEDAVNVSEADAQFTNPAEVEEFVSRTGVDSLAIAIGTSHGAYKFKPGQKPQLRFDILQQVSDRLPGFPIVLHGASSVIQADVETVNRFGGKMPDAIGIPEEMLRHAAEMAVCKINIDSDLRLAMTAAIRQHMFEHPDHFDPRQYLTPARDHIRELVRHKMHDVLGCSGKA